MFLGMRIGFWWLGGSVQKEIIHLVSEVTQMEIKNEVEKITPMPDVSMDVENGQEVSRGK